MLVYYVSVNCYKVKRNTRQSFCIVECIYIGICVRESELSSSFLILPKYLIDNNVNQMRTESFKQLLPSNMTVRYKEKEKLEREIFTNIYEEGSLVLYDIYDCHQLSQ